MAGGGGSVRVVRRRGKRAYGRVVPSRMATRRLTVLKQPIGVVGIITAWNFPAYNVARAAAAALAAGCTVVIRPSELTPLTAMEMVNVLVEAGAPAGVVNLVNGEPDAIGPGDASPSGLREDPFHRQRAGRQASDGRRVEDDDAAVAGARRQRAGAGAFLTSTSSRSRPARSRRSSATAARCASRRSGFWWPPRWPTSSSIACRPVCEALRGRQRPRSGDAGRAAHQREAARSGRRRSSSRRRSAGATVRVGGARPPDRDAGYFYQPTVVAGVDPSMPVYAERRSSAQSLPVASFDRRGRSRSRSRTGRAYGLAAYVWTNDLRTRGPRLGAARNSA